MVESDAGREAKVQEAHSHAVAAERLGDALLRKTTAAVDEAAGLDVAAAAKQAVFPVSAFLILLKTKNARGKLTLWLIRDRHFISG